MVLCGGVPICVWISVAEDLKKIFVHVETDKGVGR